MRHRLLLSWCLLTGMLVPAAGQSAGPNPDYDAIAQRMEGVLKLRRGERVLMRFDPGCFAGVIAPLERRIRAGRGLVSPPLPAADPLTGRLLQRADVYIWLPLGQAGRQLSEAEQGSLVRWLEQGGARRELHFHWAEGTRQTDGLPDAHTPGLDALYANALDIDYAALNAAMDRAIEVLRLGTVRILTPAGTDFMFRIGERPFNKQNGDASPERARAARVRVDREIELPAGALRVAPVEDSAAGQIVLPQARFGDTVARNVVFQIDNGRITRVKAESGLEAVEAELAAGGEAARRFREFALGFNPKLAVRVMPQSPGAPRGISFSLSRAVVENGPDKLKLIPQGSQHPPETEALPLRAGSRLVPYYGYGAGVVRLSLGANEELGGNVRGGFVRWFFFTDASVHVDFRYLVRGGSLVIEQLQP